MIWTITITHPINSTDMVNNNNQLAFISRTLKVVRLERDRYKDEAKELARCLKIANDRLEIGQTILTAIGPAYEALKAENDDLHRIIAERNHALECAATYIAQVKTQWNETAKLLNDYMAVQETTTIYGGHPAR